MLDWNQAVPCVTSSQPAGKSLRILSSPFHFSRIQIRFSNSNIFIKKLYFFRKLYFSFYVLFYSERVLFLPPPFQISFDSTIPVREAHLKLCASHYANFPLNYVYLLYFFLYISNFYFRIFFQNFSFYIFFPFYRIISDFKSISVPPSQILCISILSSYISSFKFWILDLKIEELESPLKQLHVNSQSDVMGTQLMFFVFVYCLNY